MHLLANNAGVAPLGNAWENSVADWEWILGVNLWGVIHGLRVFTPIMLAQNTEAHIVNTASVSGLLSPPGSAMYNVTKHAVVTLTETLYHDLALQRVAHRLFGAVPGLRAERNCRLGTQPAGCTAEPGAGKSAEQQAREALLRKAVTSGKISADEVAQKVFEAVRDERFYILTHPRIKTSIQWRMEDILQERKPTNPMG